MAPPKIRDDLAGHVNTFAPWIDDSDTAEDWDDGKDWDRDAIIEMGERLKRHLGDVEIKDAFRSDLAEED